MLKREQFLRPVRPFWEITDLVKVIIGIRRSGKSVLLEQIADELRAKGVDDGHIIAINFEFIEFAHLKTAHVLNKHILARVHKNEKYFLFFDEIQEVQDFELAVNSLRARGNLSIFITGSNAHLLSGELATHLSGRYVQFFVTPFTFSEVMRIKNGQDKQDVFEDFLKWGGLPGRFVYQTENDTRKYLQDIYDTIVLRDIIQRAKIRDLNLLDNIIQFLLDNLGGIFSAHTVAKYLKSQSRKVSAETLYNHLEYILGSLLFRKVNRYDLKGKNVFATLEKYYVADLGLLQLKRSALNLNWGARLETVVANELIARGYTINIGVKRDSEIDFVANKNGKTEYIQVAYTIDSEATLRRELFAFRGIPAKKLLITADRRDYSQDGIDALNIIDWLLAK
ncbi:MAG: ATP-binding protein [Candidatus Margulisbacteria bacterium]|jgi:predicted AAA+ superfamily ATPase|nr:ATP-binding protein [Candidatus Margulisiibacteriota bacterium]